MTKKHTKSVFIFRNDLRLQDNVGLINSLKESKSVIPVYFEQNFDLFKIKNDNLKLFIHIAEYPGCFQARG